MKIRLLPYIPSGSFGSRKQDKPVVACLLPYIAVIKRIHIPTHQKTFSSSGNPRVLTASDTACGIISSNIFSNASAVTPNMGTIAMRNQVIIYGPGTLPGNPAEATCKKVANEMAFPKRKPEEDVFYLEAGITAVHLIRQ